jgi:hypothetical protein
MEQQSGHLPVNTMTLKQLVSISAKYAAQNYLEVRPNFILDAAGQVFINPPQQMLSNSSKIDR